MLVGKGTGEEGIVEVVDVNGLDLGDIGDRFVRNRPALQACDGVCLARCAVESPVSHGGSHEWLKRISGVKRWAGLKKYHMYYRIIKKFVWERVFDGT